MKTATNLKSVELNLSDLSASELTRIYNTGTLSREQLKEFNALPIWTETKMVQPWELFGKYWEGSNAKIEMRVNRHPNCDCAPKSYIPDPALLMDTVMYVTGKRDLALGIYGETGTGKSEMPRYVSDKLNIPMLQVSLTPGSREDALMGSFQIKNGETRFDYGVVPLAYDLNSVGYMLVVNEIDKGCDNVIAKLHDIADSKPFTVEDTGEVFFPHNKFRLIVTGQTAGCGDLTGRYNVERLDRAFTARFMWSQAKYPSKQVMIDILKSEYSVLSGELIDMLGAYYHLSKKALENSRLEAEGSNSVDLGDGLGSESLNTPISIRLMKGWANLMVLHGEFRTVRSAFERTILQSAELDDKYMLDMIFKTALGEKGELPPLFDKANIEIQESEMQDISSLKFPLFLRQDDGKREIWAISCDVRGVHMLEYVEERNGFAYYYKSIADFSDGVQGASAYCAKLAKEKEANGYKHSGMITYDPETKQYARV